jgi:hypothetical protein
MLQKLQKFTQKNRWPRCVQLPISSYWGKIGKFLNQGLAQCWRHRHPFLAIGGKLEILESRSSRVLTSQTPIGVVLPLQYTKTLNDVRHLYGLGGSKSNAKSPVCLDHYQSCQEYLPSYHLETTPPNYFPLLTRKSWWIPHSLLQPEILSFEVKLQVEETMTSIPHK